MLEIPEVDDEFFDSESSSNNREQKIEKYPIIRQIKNVAKLCNLENNGIFFKYLEDYNNNIDNELKKINKFEEKLCTNNKSLKEEINKLKLTQKATQHYKEEYNSITENIKKLEKDKKNVEIKLQKINKEEKNIVTDEDKNKAKETKKAIGEIYEETNKLEEEVSLLNTALANRFSSMGNCEGSNNNFAFNTGINENLSNGNNNDDVFSQDEII